jgi:hypothetical protein
MDIAIIPTSPGQIESFHRALDVVARERKYLALLKHRRCRKCASS